MHIIRNRQSFFSFTICPVRHGKKQAQPLAYGQIKAASLADAAFRIHDDQLLSNTQYTPQPEPPELWVREDFVHPSLHHLVPGTQYLWRTASRPDTLVTLLNLSGDRGHCRIDSASPGAPTIASVPGAELHELPCVGS